MPLTVETLYALGLFGENDYLSLSPSLSVDRRKLYDHATGAKHQLHPLAEDSISRLAKGVIFHKWLIHMLEEQLTIDEIGDIIFFLNGIGAISVKRSFRDSFIIVIRRAKAQLKGFSTPALGKRSHFCLTKMLAGILAAMKILAVAAVINALLLYISGFAGWADSLIILIVFLTIILLSTLGHEYGHALVITDSKENLYILQRGMRLSVLHRRLKPHQETRVSLAGPAVGAATAIFIGCASYALLRSPVYLWVGSAIAISHLFSLLPIYSDGLSLKLAVSRRKS